MIRRLLALALLWPALALADYSSTILGTVPSPYHYYHLDETSGTSAADSKTSSYSSAANGTYTGGYTLNQTGIPGYSTNAAAKLNGSTGYVDLTGNTDWSIDQTNGHGWTVELWANASTIQNAAFIAMVHPSAAPRQWTIDSFGGKFRVILFTGDSLCGGTVLADTGNLGTASSAGEWHYIVFSTLGLGSGAGIQHLRLYADAVLLTTVTSFNAGQLCSSATNVRAGEEAANGFFFNGTIDEVAMYQDGEGGAGSGELTQAQITTHYNAGLAAAGILNQRRIFQSRRERQRHLVARGPARWFLAREPVASLLRTGTDG